MNTILDLPEPPEKLKRKKKMSFRVYICIINYQLSSDKFLQQLTWATHEIQFGKYSTVWVKKYRNSTYISLSECGICFPRFSFQIWSWFNFHSTMFLFCVWIILECKASISFEFWVMILLRKIRKDAGVGVFLYFHMWL